MKFRTLTGAFCLVFFASRLAMASEETPLLHLKNRTIHPLQEEQPFQLQKEGLFVVQFDGPIRQEGLDALVQAGVTPVHAFPTYGYLVWGLPQQLQFASYLSYVGPLAASDRMAASLAARTGMITVTVQRYVTKSYNRDAITAMAKRVLTPWHPILDYENTRLEIEASRLQELASLPDVVWVGEWKERRLYDEVQDQILAGAHNGAGTGPGGPGYINWLLSLGFSQNQADYPIVAVVDDGVGNGATNTGDATLHVQGNAGSPSRVTFNADCTGDGAQSRDGHGHINISIVGGYDNRSGFPFKDDQGYLRGLGVSPFGRVAGVRIFGNSGGFDIDQCENTDIGIAKKTYNQGARISSNSWGASVAGDYEESAQAFDAATRDVLTATSGNQEMLFVFAAGNDGPGTGTVATPGSGKNVLTVAASENSRPNDGTDGCGTGPTGADNLQDVINFSSRGPAQGNRTKPDVIAPGTHIQGTASTFSGYSGLGVCDTYWPGGQSTFARSSGTSHSTPAISGVASLIYRWLQTHYLQAIPSPALQKAYMLAHLSALTGVNAGALLPSITQGFGMPDMGMAFDDAPRIVVDQSTRFNNSGESISYEGAIIDPTKPFKVALVWTDAPGSLTGNPQVNNLDLEVTVDGVKYLGNRFAGYWSATGGSSDTANNVEIVALPAGTTGFVTIKVKAQNIAGNGVPNVGDNTDQDFALVAYNIANNSTFYLTPNQTSVTVCQSGAPSVSLDVESFQGFSSSVTLSASGLPSGVSASFTTNPVTPGNSTTLNLNITGAAAPGIYSFKVIGASGATIREAPIQLRIDGVLGAVALHIPDANATSISPNAKLNWASQTTASSYLYQVATSNTFANIVKQASIATTLANLTGLQNGTTYFWRVRASNTCGDGSFSSVRQFTTAPELDLALNCDGLPVAIPDNDGSGLLCSFSAPAGFVVSGVDVDIDITHTFRGDLRLALTAPDSTLVRLKQASTSDEADNLSGNYEQTLTAFEPGKLATLQGKTLGGVWTLLVADEQAEDTGALKVARLNLRGYVPASPDVPVWTWPAGLLASGLLLLLGFKAAKRRARRQRGRLS